ncbi:hypothetical protein DFH06DRAFT_1345233 [Mycena polygramma]|nr:hypothetical protein DFH06DRAFT_1345233 [Mycena polygramma]
MRFSLALFIASVAGLATAQSCDSNKGTCKYTSDCHAPAYYHVAGYCPGPTNYQCCIPSGCVVCAAAERDVEDRELLGRRPCC